MRPLKLPPVPDPDRTAVNLTLADLERSEEQARKVWVRQAERDFGCFWRGIRIARQDGRPRMLHRCAADFQIELFAGSQLENLKPAAERVIPGITDSLHALRDGDMPPRRRWWVERTKKGSKDADLALIVAWLVAFPRRPFYGQVGAGDKDQAAIVKDRLVHLLHHNPWLNDYIEIIKWEIRSKKKMANGDPMAKFDILAADAAGAHGGTPDLLIINELTHLCKPIGSGEEFAKNLLDNANGVAQGMVIIATNAGFKGSMAWHWRLNAMQSPEWEIRVLNRPAPWHSKATIDDARATSIPQSRFMRLWYGRWVSGKGDALDEEAINECFKHTKPMKRISGWQYIIGLDLGIKHDHAGEAVIGVNTTERRIRVARLRAWEPEVLGDGSERVTEVNLVEVEEQLLKDWAYYGKPPLYCDPTEARLMMQRLRLKGVVAREMAFASPSNLKLMASALIQTLNNRTLEAYDTKDGRLRRDFGKFNIVEKGLNGYKLEAVSDEFGHADVGTALVIVLPAAVALLGGTDGLQPDDVLSDPDELGDLNEKEVQELPPELRDIWDAEEDQTRDDRINRWDDDDPYADLF